MTSLSALATVELQLLMHALDRSSLLSLARCSHTTLAAASQPFAWHHCAVTLRCAGVDVPAPPLYKRLALLARSWFVSAARASWAAVGLPLPEPERPATRVRAELVGALPLLTPPVLLAHHKRSLLRFARNSVVHWNVGSSGVMLLEHVDCVAQLGPLQSVLINRWKFAGEAVMLAPPELWCLATGLLRSSAASLTSLSLRDQRVGEVGGAALAALLNGAPQLHTLSLVGCRMEANSARLLAGALARHPALTTLDLNDNHQLGSAGCAYLARAFASAPALTNVELRGCGLDDEAAVVLASSIRQSRTLCSANLEANALMDVGVEVLADAMASAEPPSRWQESFWFRNPYDERGNRALMAAKRRSPEAVFIFIGSRQM
jgi:Ran GTPase-activating protein (RanGAP) involved in mRNA processing and transport